MEQNYQDWDAERKRRRWDYWNALRLMRLEYLEEYKDDQGMTRPTLHFWAEGKYGIKMGMDGEGGYTEDWDVTDPRKYMIFQLKFWR